MKEICQIVELWINGYEMNVTRHRCSENEQKYNKKGLLDKFILWMNWTKIVNFLFMCFKCMVIPENF